MRDSLDIGLGATLPCACGSLGCARALCDAIASLKRCKHMQLNTLGSSQPAVKMGSVNKAVQPHGIPEDDEWCKVAD